ncbi:uncharacterized protein LOC114244475 [Bombyx mandarina]|nr:uncharacterized protein LOC114244475 [Bombyx mandarina]
MGCIGAVFSFALLVTMIVEATMVGVEDNNIIGPYIDVEREARLTGLYVMAIILTLMFLAKFIFDLVFVYGVVMERAGIVKAYFIMWAVFFFLSVSVFFLNCLDFNTSTIVLEVFYIGLNIYAILLSHSFYKQLNTREDV